MANGVFAHAQIQKAHYVWLNEGIVYGNYGTDNYNIGVTRGGSVFLLENIIKEIQVDGAYGPIKNMRRVTKCVGSLMVNFLKLSYVNLAYGLNITVADGTDEDGTYKKMSFRLGFESTDVLDNIAYVGQKMDGENCIIFVNNALNVTDNIRLDFKEKDEVISPMTYKGFYDYGSPTTPPIEIWDYIPS